MKQDRLTSSILGLECPAANLHDLNTIPIEKVLRTGKLTFRCDVCGIVFRISDLDQEYLRKKLEVV